MSTLYIDIDSTIWPAELEYDRVALQLFGKPFGPDWYDIPDLIAKFGPNYKQIFRLALDPERIPNRGLYPGVPWALYVLRGQGFHLHFISHNDHDFEPTIKAWLQDQLPTMPFDITVHPTEEMDKVEFMSYDPNAWGIIEDKVDTLLSALEAGYHTYAKRQPWNTLTLASQPAIIGFDDWAVLPARVIARKEVMA